MTSQAPQASALAPRLTYITTLLLALSSWSAGEQAHNAGTTGIWSTLAIASFSVGILSAITSSSLFYLGCGILFVAHLAISGFLGGSAALVTILIGAFGLVLTLRQALNVSRAGATLAIREGGPALHWSDLALTTFQVAGTLTLVAGMAIAGSGSAGYAGILFGVCMIGGPWVLRRILNRRSEQGNP